MKNLTLLLITILCIIFLFSCDIPFIGGFINGNTDENSDDDSGNKETTPEFYTVTFESNGGTTVKPQSVRPGAPCSKPYAPIRYGATFAGWYCNGTPWNFKNPITKDLTLEAKWNFTKYTITYDLSGGQFSSFLPSSYTVETDTIVLTAPTKGDYEFAGWYLDGKLVTEIPKGSSGDILLVADFYGPDASVLDSATASVRTWDNGTNITVRLTDNSADTLTVKVNIPKQWHTVKVQQDKKIDYIQTYQEGDKLMLDFTMTAGSDDTVITPVILMGETELVSNFGKELSDGTKVSIYFPGFVRKSVTFTIDDGDYAMDTKFLTIVRPAGIIGTFNLKNTSAANAAKLASLYKGYEIASHHALHCLPENEAKYSATYSWDTLQKKDEVFNSSTADPQYMYKSADVEGLWYIATAYWSTGVPPIIEGSTRWDPVADNETYIKYIDLTKNDLESVFGEGSVVGYAAPHGEFNETVRQYLKDNGYLYARRAGTPNNGDTNGDGVRDFNIPADRYNWTYNAWHSTLNDVMRQYDNLRDDGNLKVFSFGVHSADYELQNGTGWTELQKFANTYGNRPEDFWYATNREIFEYEDATKELEIKSSTVTNNSDIAIFVTIGNVKTIIPAHSVYNHSTKTISQIN